VENDAVRVDCAWAIVEVAASRQRQAALKRERSIMLRYWFLDGLRLARGHG